MMGKSERDNKYDELQRRRRFYDAQLKALSHMNTGHMMMFGDDDALCAVPRELRFDIHQMLMNWYSDGIARIDKELKELVGGEDNG